MTDLIPITALGTAQAESVHIGAFTVQENTGLALASLACADTLKPFGLYLPKPGQMAQTAAGHMAIWIGQDQWMITAQDQAEPDFAATVLAELGAANAKVTEQTDGWVAFDIVAPDADHLQTLLEHLVNLPKTATAPGCGTRTLIHHISVLIARPTDQNLTVLGLRSYAESLHQTLVSSLQNAT